MMENFPKLGEEVLIQTQESFRIPNREVGEKQRNKATKRTSLDHVITKTPNI